MAAAQVEFAPDLARDPRHYKARAGGVDLWTTDTGVVLAVRSAPRQAAAIALSFGAARVRGEDQFCRARNWMRGGQRAASERDARRVVLEAVVPGCDVVWRESSAGGFEYDLRLSRELAGACPTVTVEGHEALWLAPDGSLVIETAVGALVQPPPRAFQVVGGVERDVPCAFRLEGPARYGFELGAHLANEPLVVDPALRWSTYISGQYEQSISAVAAGVSDCAVVVGVTESVDFPTTLGAFDPFYNGATDAFVSCIAPDGRSLVWSTMLGGVGDDAARSVVVDAAGVVTVAGETTSTDFPSTTGAFDTSFGGDRDVFVAQLSVDGSVLEWSTFLGGTLADRCGELARAANGDLVAVGTTRASGFPVTAGAFDTTFNGGGFFGDVFVTRLAQDGASLRWSTFLGSSQEEVGERLALSAQDEIVLAGTAYSALFPTSSGAFDRTWQAPSEAFVARLSSNGAQLVFSTLLGGSGEEFVRAVAVESSGSVLCVGECTSGDFPTTPLAPDTQFDGASDGFVARISSDGAQLVDSSFFGGADTDRVVDVVLDAQGALVLGCETSSVDLSTTSGCLDPDPNMPIGSVEQELFIARWPANFGAPTYATYFGSTNADALAGLALTQAGEVLLAGTTQGPGFPVSSGAFQPSWNVTALHDGFAARLAFLTHPVRFGTGKLNSGGTAASIRWSGFPSLGDNDFSVGVDFALPNVWCQVFRGAHTVNWPFLGHLLRVGPPYRRYARFKSDFLGYGQRAIPIEPWMVGQTLYFQVWYEDVSDPFGAALTDALRVIVYP